MIGVWAFVRVDMLHVQHFPCRLARLQEDVIEAMAEKGATPRPADLMRGGVSVLVDLAERILPMQADILDLVRMFRGIEVTRNNGRSA